MARPQSTLSRPLSLIEELEAQRWEAFNAKWKAGVESDRWDAHYAIDCPAFEAYAAECELLADRAAADAFEHMFH